MTSAQFAAALQKLAAFLSALTAFDVGTTPTPRIIFSFTDLPSFCAAMKSLGDGSFTFHDAQMVDFVSGTQPVTLRLIGPALNLAQQSGVLTMATAITPTPAVSTAAKAK